jgi:hypothetical protein
MEPAYELLSELGIKMAADAGSMQALIRRLLNANSTEHDYERGEYHMHSSLTVFSPEFTVFLGYDQKDLMSMLCDWYDCRPRWVYETISRDKEEVIGVWVNILGATVPRLIQSSMPLDAIGGGLTGRMIFVFEEAKGKFVPFQELTEEQEVLWENLKNDLEKIYMLKGRFKYSKEFVDNYIDWRANAEASPPRLPEDRFDGYVSRRPMHLMKLSMIMSASNRDDLVLKHIDLKRAVATLDAVEIKMGQTFAGVGKSPTAELITKIMAFVRRQGETTYTDLIRMFYQDADDYTMEKLVRTLERMKYIDVVEGGKNPRIVYKGGK